MAGLKAHINSLMFYGENFYFCRKSRRAGYLRIEGMRRDFSLFRFSGSMDAGTGI